VAPLEFSVWSDIACPWCYVGKRRLDAALAAWPEGAGTRVVWREAMIDRMASLGAAEGIDFRFDLVEVEEQDQSKA
jgi:hypothetical protein